MVGLDVTHKALVSRADAERLRKASRTGRLVAELLDFYDRFHRDVYGFDGSPIHDALAVAQVVRPALLELAERNVEVDCASELSRGRTVVDLWQRTGRTANAKVAVDVDAPGFVELLVERLASHD